MNITCAALTQNGTPCLEKTLSSSTLCTHHQQMQRMMKLAGKSLPVHHTSSVISSSSSRSSSPVRQHHHSISSPVQKTPSSSSSSSSYLPDEVEKAILSCQMDIFSSSNSFGRNHLYDGHLKITNYRLFFISSSSTSSLPYILRDAREGIPLATVRKIGYPQTSSSSEGMPTHVVVHFKDGRIWKIKGNLNNLITTLTSQIFVHSPASLFAFARGKRMTANDSTLEQQGHSIFNIYADFLRMGVDVQKGKFRISDLNSSYTVCPTYPKLLAVPAGMTDTQLSAVASFRAKGRIPILSWVHGNGASMWRCAQPKRGIFNEKNDSDTQLLATIGRSNPTSNKVWIVDARPELNARANNFTGGGTESASIRHATVSFMNIANIHAMRESLSSVLDLLHNGGSELDFNWWTKVEETKWLSHLRRVLSASLRVAHAINDTAQTVIVHCSDGWDRTGQICALAQLFLDPYYRTLTGFMQLIEKEWITVGHKFNDRIGPCCQEDDQQSPVFLQFLDCCWQLLRLYPTWFEFNAIALEFIADSLFSARFGTFLCNCERERMALGISTRTTSLWTNMNRTRHKFTNHFYRSPENTSTHASLTLLPHPSTLLRQVTLWSDYYGRKSAVPSFVAGNPLPPLFQKEREWKVARTVSDDLDASMSSLHFHLQRVETDACKSPPPAPAVLVQKAIQYAKVTPRLPLPIPPSPLSLDNGKSSSTTKCRSISSEEAEKQYWSCQLCTKTNVLENVNCSVCGRPPLKDRILK